MYNCPVELTVEVMGGKWKSRILWHINKKPYRYGELRKLIPNITQKMLTQALRELEEDGLIVRKVFEGNVLKVEYSLTEYGQTTTPLLELMSQWGKNHKHRIDRLKAEENKVEIHTINKK
ncbi:helix-turn-helix domain-containing protein [Bacillus sp. 31A1R]|uniref:Helix-turn-helix domain-containing protein n=1 Tax=Robertmurraya mangrovi TaxID=3098077 RepID=A0ABU5J554_9BACI|nr:helix-turn-helix domain-containing protein [Bacillus sp. 31A1R]MDZ5474472.1 helix-turn-helix domain-containing protein [Bacillus sp. 31A1R]